MTLFVQVKEGKGDSGPDLDQWHPWINCDDLEHNRPGEMTAGLIAQRFLRARGGIPIGEKLTFTIFSYCANERTHPNGRPMAVNALTLSAGKVES